MPTGNNTIKIAATEQGAAAAIWVQSSSDWWMVGIDSEYNTIPGNTAYAYSQNAYSTSQGQNTSNQFSFTNYAGPAASTYWASSDSYSVAQGQNSGTTNYTSKNTTTGPTFTFGPPLYKSSTTWTSSTTGGNYFWFTNVSTNYSAYSNYYYYPANTSYAWNSVSYFWFTSGGNYATFSFTNATTNAFSQILRVRQSVGGTVSTITSSIVSTVQTAASILVSLVGNQITAKAYSDTNFVNQLGSDLVYTATGATINTRYGIAISPTAYQPAPESGIIGSSVTITRN
jgi:hypothetical protein